MEYYDDYDKKYPELILMIIEYFDDSNKQWGGVEEKSVKRFCELYSDKKKHQYVYNPIIVDRICKKLCDCNIITCIKKDTGLGLENNYICIFRNKEMLLKNKMQMSYYYNSIVYGFKYIYECCKKMVMPLVMIKPDGGYTVGTGFKFCGGIVTARHCIEDVNNLQIKGYTASELNTAKIYYSENPGVDIAFIDLGREEKLQLLCEVGEIMQDVLVVGYPKIPGFTDFLTAEIATVSSKAISRVTPTVGAIAAYGKQYLAKIEAMLITAKIRGGNSGGPVINSNGNLVGIACQIPNYEGEIGDYDDLGYGIAVPIQYLNEIIEGKKIIKHVPENFFRDFEG